MSMADAYRAEQLRISTIRNRQKRRREEKKLRRAAEQVERQHRRTMAARYNRASMNGIKIDDLMRRATRNPRPRNTIEIIEDKQRWKLPNPFAWMAKPFRRQKAGG